MTFTERLPDLPPGVSGREPEIGGEDDHDDAVTRDPMVAFLYLLFSEELPYNRVARLVDRVAWLGSPSDQAFRMSSNPLAMAAIEARDLLRPAPDRVEDLDG